MKVTYLFIILAVVIVLGWAIHYYSDRLTFGPGGAPSTTSMVPAAAVRAG
ncbi:MAG TPA: hypothetical protein VMD75_02785 [Candidatus Binataceae bacterium]|nr:hypothetical protein [Candidatus Binataceae bacterium]